MVDCNECVHYSICSHYKDHRHECDFFMKDKNTVEVVRCKDCTNCTTIGIPRCRITGRNVTDDDFCSRGERKDE